MITSPSTSNTNRDILTVSQANRQAKRLLETHFASVWIDGEISNFSTPSSGHWYLTLKAQNAQIKCAMFRSRNARLKFRPENGMRVFVRGKISLYEGRGDYQIILEYMEAAGDGALQLAFEQLKAKLDAEGLFDNQYKQPIPELPNHIGVVTSPTGAAFKDILSVLKRRFPGIPVTIIPVSVQGQDAALQIADSIALINKQDSLDLPFSPNIDVLIVGRGGGSIEDLWSFNKEVVARAIFDSNIPIVSAVGHEIDFTIADFVADVRAPTPSAAAELLSPDRDEWLSIFSSFEQLLEKAIKQILEFNNQQLAWLQTRLRHPGSRLQEQAQRLDELESRLKNSISQTIKMSTFQLANHHEKLKQVAPHHRIQQYSLQLLNISKLLNNSIARTITHHQQRLSTATQLLDTVSPLATLSRGYAIVTIANKKSTTDKKIVSTAKQLKQGDIIDTRLGKGSFQAEVIDITS